MEANRKESCDFDVNYKGGFYQWGSRGPKVHYSPGNEKSRKKALENEISVEDMQKIVDANEKIVKEMKDGKD